jgi:lipopolysaccharide heptosyltransferase III
MTNGVLALVNARIGDTLLVTPALRAIKAAWPDRALVVRAHRDRAPLLAGLPFVDRVDVLPRRAFRATHLLARRRFDVAFCWSDDRGLQAYCRRAARRVVAFDTPARIASVGVPRPVQLMHAVDERLLLPAALGIAPAGKALAYVVTPRERAWAAGFVASLGAAGSDLVGITLASFPGKAYRDWPVERFAALCRALASEDPKLRFVVLGDAASRDRAAALMQALPARVIDATARTTLRESAALIERLRLYVGVDTGPTHLAGGLGTPMVALYHCFHRGRYLAPLEHPALEVIEHPCPDDACSRQTPMGDVDVEPVLAACRRLLTRPDPRRSPLAA